jgi:predicted AlkP superfamily pyrophosphatase or phosphodiesterase
MKKLIVMLFILLGVNSYSKSNVKRVLIVGLDGISVEGYNKANIPNLKALAKSGVSSMNTRSVMPSVTLPNWTSHMCSAGPEQHGAHNNGWRIDNIKMSPTEKDADGYFPSIFKILKDQVYGVKTAYYYNWAELINTMNKKYIDEHVYQKDDGYIENYGRALEFMKENRDNPTFVFLYSVHTDHAGHKYRWMSDEYIKSIEEADVEIGKLFEKMKKEGIYDDTVILFVSDHGGKPESGHGGFSYQEMLVPWVISGPSIKSREKLNEPNFVTNTAITVAHIMGCQYFPKSWIGKVPTTIFE